MEKEREGDITKKQRTWRRKVVCATSVCEEIGYLIHKTYYSSGSKRCEVQLNNKESDGATRNAREM